MKGLRCPSSRRRVVPWDLAFVRSCGCCDRSTACSVYVCVYNTAPNIACAAMVQEARGNFSAAEDIYRAITKETPSNQLAAKRLIALARQVAVSKTGHARADAEGRVFELMNEYLQLFGGDIEAVRKGAATR